jgi:hypothetical protein
MYAAMHELSDWMPRGGIWTAREYEVCSVNNGNIVSDDTSSG